MIHNTEFHRLTNQIDLRRRLLTLTEKRFNKIARLTRLICEENVNWYREQSIQRLKSSSQDLLRWHNKLYD